MFLFNYRHKTLLVIICESQSNNFIFKQTKLDWFAFLFVLTCHLSFYIVSFFPFHGMTKIIQILNNYLKSML